VLKVAEAITAARLRVQKGDEDKIAAETVAELRQRMGKEFQGWGQIKSIGSLEPAKQLAISHLEPRNVSAVPATDVQRVDRLRNALTQTAA
jgi:hypothetical protein